MSSRLLTILIASCLLSVVLSSLSAEARDCPPGTSEAPIGTLLAIDPLFKNVSGGYSFDTDQGAYYPFDEYGTYQRLRFWYSAIYRNNEPTPVWVGTFDDVFPPNLLCVGESFMIDAAFLTEGQELGLARVEDVAADRFAVTRSPTFTYHPTLSPSGYVVEAPWKIGEEGDAIDNQSFASMFKLAVDAMERLNFHLVNNSASLGWATPLILLPHNVNRKTGYNPTHRFIQIARNSWKTQAVLHEIGHAIEHAWTVSGAAGIPGNVRFQYLYPEKSPPQLNVGHTRTSLEFKSTAWSEGFADFVALAATRRQDSPNTTYCFSTTGSASGPGCEFFENTYEDCGRMDFRLSSSVTRFLWDLYDLDGPGGDADGESISFLTLALNLLREYPDSTADHGAREHWANLDGHSAEDYVYHLANYLSAPLRDFDLLGQHNCLWMCESSAGIADPDGAASDWTPCGPQ